MLSVLLNPKLHNPLTRRDELKITRSHDQSRIVKDITRNLQRGTNKLAKAPFTNRLSKAETEQPTAITWKLIVLSSLKRGEINPY